MTSYVTGVLVALFTVFALYAGIELAAGNSLFGQEKFANVPTEELIEMARDRRSGDQIDAVIQLGKRPMEMDVTVLVLAPLTMSPDANVKTAAESALNEIGAPAAGLIKPYFDDEKTRSYKIGCSAARSIGPACSIYMDEFIKLLDSANPMERRCALYALQGQGENSLEAIDGVIKCLSDSDFNNQCMACRILEPLGPKAIKAEAALTKLLEGGVPSTRGWAAVCLSAIGPTPSNEKVIEMIAKKMEGDGIRPLNPVELQRYIKALAHFGPKAEKHLDKVRKRLEHRDTFIRCHSAFAIYKITGEAEETLEVFKSVVEQDVFAGDALELVSKMGDKAVPFIPSIIRCLDSPDPGNRELALVALNNIGPQAAAAISKVEELIDDKDALVRIAARATLASLNEPLETVK